MILKRFHVDIQSENSTLLQYESLRSRALNKQKAFYQGGLGLALFIRKGMLAWIDVRQRCLPKGSKSDKRQDVPVFSYVTTSEMIKVMATITLFNLEGAAPCM